MLGLAIRLALGGKAIIARAWGWLTASTTHLLIAACAALAIWGYIGHHNAAKWHRVSESMKQAYAAAQADAVKAQAAADLATSARYSALAKESEHEHQIALEGAHSAVSAYAASHRVPSCPASQASGTKPAAVPGDSSLATGTGPETGMVAVSSADLDQLAAGTVRAESCRAWGQSLIDAGLGIAGD